MTGIITSNKTNEITRKKEMIQFLGRMGIDEEDIIMESAAQNTFQEAINVKRIIKSLSIEEQGKILLITSAYHMPRAKKCFEKIDFHVIPFSVDFIALDLPLYSVLDLFPNEEALVNWHLLSKEWLGLLVYKILGYV